MQNEAQLLVEDFLEYKRGRSISSTTINNYYNNMKDCINYYNITSVDAILKMTREQVTTYLRYLLKERKLEISSHNTHLIAIRSFYSYLKNERKMSIDDTILTIENIKPPIKNAIWLDVVEIDRLLKTIKQPRAKAMIYLFLKTGIRVSELINIQLSDIKEQVDSETDEVFYTILIHGKGNKERVVCAFRDTKDALDKYINKYRAKIVKRTQTTEQYLFLSNNGHKMSSYSIDRTIKMWARRSDLPNADKLSPHKLRHSYCTNMIDAEVPIRNEDGIVIGWAKKYSAAEVSASMGHSNMQITSRYSHTKQKKINAMQREGW